LRVSPCIPASWPGFEVAIRRNSTNWRIIVKNPHGLQQGATSIRLDGQLLPSGELQLVDDGREHRVDVEIDRT
jgi:cellobiose phosphorylase